MQGRFNQSMGRAGVAARAAFSLVELMIAIVILGFGILVVGAALPVGLDYTQKTANAAIGDMAAQYGLEVIEQYVRTSSNLVGQSIDPTLPFVRKDSLVRPRDFSKEKYPILVKPSTFPPPPNNLIFPFEPAFKVRPFVFRNVDVTPDRSTKRGETQVARAEETELLISKYLDDLNGSGLLVEYDVYPDFGNYNFALTGDGGFVAKIAGQPGIPDIMRVYPPVSPAPDPGLGDPEMWRFRDRYLTSFIKDIPPLVARYARRGVGDRAREKAVSRLISWTAFYRRVSYDHNSDDLLYEVICVAAKRTTPDHRFPQQAYFKEDRNKVFSEPFAVPMTSNGRGSRSPGQPGVDRLAPVPWLVHFSSFGVLPKFDDQNPAVPGRPLTEPDTSDLKFTCSLEVGTLLPAGSMFIPARNNYFTGGGYAIRGLTPPFGGDVGFFPHSPESLPIYEVVKRELNASADEYIITIKNNGLYPYTGDQNNPVPSQWPVWVIPPSVKVTASGSHTFESDSPIVAIARRFVRIREID